MNPADDIILKELQEHVRTVERLIAQRSIIQEMADRIIDCLKASGKILFFGNGGSAADAQHLAAEFVIRYRKNRRSLPSLALTTDTSMLTACGNDFGFETIFSRQVEGLANAGDVAIGITTSGNSMNVVKGLEEAKRKGCFTISWTAESGGKVAEIADLAFKAPSPVTARAQECHMIAGHIICELVDGVFDA